MEPKKFKGHNVNLNAPKGQEDKVSTLPALVSYEGIVSCWELSAEDLKEIQENKCIYLGIMGQAHPPVWMMASKPKSVSDAEKLQDAHDAKNGKKIGIIKG